MLATQDVCVSNDLLRQRLIQRRRVIDLQELAFAREAAEFACSDAWDEDGSVSAIDWIRFNCHMTAGAAANAVAVGEALPRLPESHQAVVDCEIGGQLDAVGGAAVLTALAPLACRSGAHDHRDQEQRNADALVELASGGGSQAQIQVTSSLATLLALAGAPAAEMEHSLPVSSKTIERLACDSSIARVLLDSESVVIDVGRSKRVVSEPGRRALAARDGHCRWPECERPASRSAAHHVVHWIHGGSTDLDNLILLCHRHHWMVHEGSWQLVRGNDGTVRTIPPIVTFGPSP